MNFDQERKERVIRIEELLRKYLPKEKGYQKTVMEAMNYSLMAGGKRLRPMLMEETFRLFDGQEQSLLEHFMAAIEMIHTYSLVHDDLPAMDNDEYRRGRKTTHIVYGEAMGILAGDGLLNYAFEIAAKAYREIDKLQGVDELTAYKRVAEALEILAEKAGIYGMIGGQVVDVEEHAETACLERLNFIYQLKTAALVEASMTIGAVIAGASKESVNQIEQIAGLIGLAFQIQDDILDVTSTEEILGKPINSDLKNGKTTYVTLLGLDKAREAVLTVSEEAVRLYDALGYKNEFLKVLILKLITRDC